MEFVVGGYVLHRGSRRFDVRQVRVLEVPGLVLDGGGRVGLLLISPFVKPGSVDETGYYNHFSLLLSIENLFGLKPLGYASNPALSAFEETVFNAKP